MYDDERASVQCDQTGFTSLSSFLMEYQAASRKERKTLYERWLNLIVRPAEAVSGTTPEALRPMVKSRSDFLNMSRQVMNMGAKVAIPTTPLTESLSVSLALDGEDAMRFASIKDLASMDLTPDSGLTKAVSNLATVPFTPQELVEGLHLIGQVDGYDSARFLIDGAFEPLHLSTPLVLVAARDLIFVTDLEQPGALDRLLDVSFRTTNDPDLIKRVSLIPIVKTSTGWKDLTLEPSHPSFEKLDALRKLQIGQWYHDQRLMLTETHPELPVAKLSGVQLPDGTGHHLVSLVADEGLFPVADLVGVLHEDVPRLISWDAFLKLAGTEAQLEEGTWPPLYRVNGEALFLDRLRFAPVWKTMEEAFGVSPEAQSPAK